MQVTKELGACVNRGLQALFPSPAQEPESEANAGPKITSVTSSDCLSWRTVVRHM